jgi:hypothetical protein
MSRVPLDPCLAADLTVFVTGGWAVLINAWLIEGEEPLDPEEFADRVLRLVQALTGPAGIVEEKEGHR